MEEKEKEKCETIMDPSDTFGARLQRNVHIQLRRQRSAENGEHGEESQPTHVGVEVWRLRSVLSNSDGAGAHCSGSRRRPGPLASRSPRARAASTHTLQQHI